MIRFVDLQRQYETIKAEIDECMKYAASSGAYVLGAPVAEFERSFAAYCGAAHCVGVASGTDALTIILEAIGVSSGDEVILPANTFIATAYAVSRVGARPVLIDVEPRSMLATADIIARAITKRTKAIIPVHLFGSPVDIDPIRVLAESAGVAVIEDACQAHGAIYKGKRVGSLGVAAAFSFYPAKNLGAYGDGGAIVTDDESIVSKARLLRDLGQRKKYDHAIRGHNSRLDALQAAVLSAKLPYLERWNAARRERAAWYDEEFKDSGIALGPLSEGESAYHLYPVRLDHRDQVAATLREDGIESGIHYPVPIHLSPAYADLAYKHGDFPVTEEWSRRSLSLPMFPELSQEEVRRVARVVLQAEGSTRLAGSSSIGV